MGTVVHVEVIDASRSSDRDGSLAMRWRWAGSRGVAESRFARVEIEEVSRREVRAVASTGPGPEGRAAVLSLLATALAERLGGLVLHATAVVVAGRAILFVGPSGAGKTTAANHTSGATWLCRDRALVVPDDVSGWTAWAIAGGDDVRLPRASDVCAPVGGILRVLRGKGSSRIVPLSRATSLLRLRESIQSGGTDTHDEERALESALRLLDDVTFAAIEVALGTDLGEIVAGVASSARKAQSSVGAASRGGASSAVSTGASSR